jgi:pimeloyl-ACP methyl ester carboxylesterase
MITLNDGRRVAFEEYGDPAGHPALWFHGASSSRLEGGFLAEAARERGLRLISLDRPGAGGSDPHPGRSVVGYAADVVEILDVLELEQVAVGGLSNGGMFAMAVAHALPARVLRAVPLNASAPIADAAAWAALTPEAQAAYTHLTTNAEAVAQHLATHPDISIYLDPATNPDAHLFADPETAAAFRANLAEGARQQRSEYLSEELALVSADWGFDHRAVPVPVAMASGEVDSGRGYAEIWAEELPRGRLVLLPGGHLNILDPQVAGRIVELLLGHA